jgi:aldehyde dehydrogenase family 7 protein A1
MFDPKTPASKRKYTRPHHPAMPSIAQNLSVPDLLSSLDISTSTPNAGAYDGKWFGSGEKVQSFNPSNGKPLATITQASDDDTQRVLRAAKAASKVWRNVPAPERGRVMRLIRNAIDDKVDELGMLITLEMGKIVTEGRGEVVEFIDVADYAVGLSRSIGGTVLPSERKKHFMTEVCHPLGVIGVISAFNFPIAVSIDLYRLLCCPN